MTDTERLDALAELMLSSPSPDGIVLQVTYTCPADRGVPTEIGGVLIAGLDCMKCNDPDRDDPAFHKYVTAAGKDVREALRAALDALEETR